MAYKVIILYRLYMPSYFLGTFTEYPYLYLYTQYIRLFFIIVHQILYRHLTLNSLTERNNGF